MAKKKDELKHNPEEELDEVPATEEIKEVKEQSELDKANALAEDYKRSGTRFQPSTTITESATKPPFPRLIRTALRKRF